MKERIQEMIATLKSAEYDEEGQHIKYDDLLEDFTRTPDLTLLPLMQELVEIETHFWYA